MVSFNVSIKEGETAINVCIPIDDWLADDEKMGQAQIIIDGIEQLSNSPGVSLFINEQLFNRYKLKGLLHHYRSLYCIKILEDVLERVKPLNDPIVKSISEKVEPLIEHARFHVNNKMADDF